jgi:hypothetical protein
MTPARAMPSTPMPVRARRSVARLPGVSIGWGAALPSRRVRSGVPLFVGFVEPRAADAPAERMRPVALERWEDWSRLMPAPAAGHLDYAVRGFFQNAGARCWVWPLPLPAAHDAASMANVLTGFFRAGAAIDDLAEPDLVCVPDAVLAPLGHDAERVLAVQRAVLAHCRRLGSRLALFDCLPAGGGVPPTPHERIAGLSATSAADPVDAANGAVYWPWVSVAGLPREAGAGRAARDVPPCGHVAGVIARIDAAAGRHKAPANEALEGVHDVDQQAPPDVVADLADDGVNALRTVAARGVMVCGARTLSRRPMQRHIHARRVVLGLVRWSELGLRDLAWENQSPALWERMRQRLLGWCLERHREGALQGDAPEQAYFVQCDAETNPPDEIRLGRVHCRMGLAITTPAEFIEIKLIQSAEGLALAE